MNTTAPKFQRQDIGSANVRFPTGSSMPDPLDVAVDPYGGTKRTKGTNVKGFQAWPQKSGPFPGVLLLHDWWGLTSHVQDLTFRLALHGFVALAVDQYSRTGGAVASEAGHARELMGRLNHQHVMQDLLAAVEYLNFQDYVKKNRIAVVGFGMGGSHALSFAGDRRQLRAAVSFYGHIPLDKLGGLRCPVLYHRAGQDDSVTDMEIQQLSQKLAENKVVSEIQTYPDASRGFFDDTRPETYHADAAATAWGKTLEFLDRYILAEHAGLRPLTDKQRGF